MLFMILQKYIEVIINSRNYKHYTNVIENIENKKKYLILVDDLLCGSHSKILVSCDICNRELMKPYRQYLQSTKNENLYCCSPKCSQFKNKITNLNRYGVENVFMSDDIKVKILNKNNEKYGVDYPSQSKEIRFKSQLTSLKNYGVSWASKSKQVRDKMRESCLVKYGTIDFASSEIAKEIRIKNKQQICDELKTEFDIYQNKVRRITNRLRKKLYENWNGIDFYDKENIFNNLNLKNTDKRYPTIDHKISIYYGFINKIDIEVIGGLENLCITKRSINSTKGTSCFI